MTSAEIDVAEALENTYPWRTGRKVGRTIYAQLGAEPSDADLLIGLMDSTEIAEEAVRAHNLSRRTSALPGSEEKEEG